MRRVQSGQSALFMVNPRAGQLGGAPFEYFADWIDGHCARELSQATPRSPGAPGSACSEPVKEFPKTNAVPLIPSFPRKAGL